MPEICVVEVMEITPEEKQKIINDRLEDERKKELKKCFATLKDCLAQIRELGGAVYLPLIGGKYIPRHFPMVSEGILSLSFKREH